MKWLKDPNTRGSRFGLYGLMLGHCGKPADAKTIRELLDDKERSFSSGLDGVLVGYIMLDKKAGLGLPARSSSRARASSR